MCIVKNSHTALSPPPSPILLQVSTAEGDIKKKKRKRQGGVNSTGPGTQCSQRQQTSSPRLTMRTLGNVVNVKKKEKKSSSFHIHLLSRQSVNACWLDATYPYGWI